MAMTSKVIRSKKDTILLGEFLRDSKNKYQAWLGKTFILSGCQRIVNYLLKLSQSSFFCQTEIRTGPS